MIMNDIATDAENRLLALDPSHSFIVQAPAGSGKTSLLTQRFLRLLVTVKNPENILAITFTKKAAAEMHQRIIDALKMAQKPKPEQPYLQQTWLLAAEVLQVSADNNWQLLSNTSRLRVQTIDSLCAYLTKQMPVLAQFGSQPSVETDCRPMYEMAARAVLAELENSGEEGDAIRLLVSHLDNQLNRSQDLIADMLAKRDQWLRHVLMAGSIDRADLENVLQSSLEHGLQQLADSFSAEQKQNLAELLNFASSYVDPKDDLASIGKAFDFDYSDYSSHKSWLLLVNFLLTSTGGFRKSATVALGFPAQAKGVDKAEKDYFSSMKTRYKELLLELSESPALLAVLLAVKALPSPVYSENQWQFIQALMSILPLAVAHLRMVFQQYGRVDFCEVSLSASRALHDETGITDQGLKLDYQLQHILVDEFQDTSETQYELLKDLVSGWQPDDGRSLFLVGDPMQSIYRFRQAEVGLFLKTQQQGLGEVEAIWAINISANFRSQAGIVNWINTAFNQLMPVEDAIYSSAISFKASIATHENSEEAVFCHPHISRLGEGEKLAELITALQAAHPDDTVGVLVRSRAALKDLVQQLNAAQIAYQASDIDPLASREVVIDLLSLTRAILQPADKVAWLAILRAPWCGLYLEDINALVKGAENGNIIDLLKDTSKLQTLTKDGQLRLQNLTQHMSYALSERERMPLVDTVKGLWVALSGASYLVSEVELQDAQRYFDCLAELESAASVDLKTLLLRVEKLYSAIDTKASGTLQIMTIHKSKGLEFDHVILPGLDRQAANDSSPLLEWLERPSAVDEGSELLIAPIKETGDKNKEAISEYIAYTAKQKSKHESQRLLYVAASRAKKTLHLSFTVKQNKQQTEISEPIKSSLLSLLWPSIKSNVAIDFHVDNLNEKSSLTNRKIKRIKEINGGLKQKYPASLVFENIPKPVDWGNALATSIGTVCHRLMELIGIKGIRDKLAFDQQFSERSISNLLREAGVLESQLSAGIEQVSSTILSCLKDKRGLWILDHQHTGSAFEYALSGVINGEVKQFRLDRTFVANDVRWIIDYKTSQTSAGDIESFLDKEKQNYQPQLEQYAQLMSVLDTRPIKLAIYHPAYAGWREWSFLK